MEKKILQIHEVGIDELKSVIQDSIRLELNGFINAQRQPTTNEKLLSRSEVMELLKISEATLYNYEKKGKLKGFQIGGRRLYKESEIFESLKEKK